MHEEGIHHGQELRKTFQKEKNHIDRIYCCAGEVRVLIEVNKVETSFEKRLSFLPL